MRMKKTLAAILMIVLLLTCLTGVVYAAGWEQSNGGWYYRDSSGALCKNQWVKDNTGWCYLV